MERLSNEISWIVRKSSEDMRSMAMRDAKVTSVKNELISKIEEQID
jgi:hypothetical protein